MISFKRNSCWLLLALIFLTFAATPALSMDKYSITPFAGYYGFENDEYYSDTGIGGAALGYTLEDNWTIEGSYGFMRPRSTMEGTDANGHLLRAEVLYNIRYWDKFIPFIAAGGGGIFLDSNEYERSSAILSYGAGAKYFLTEDWAVRGDIRHILADNQRPTNQMLVTFGLTYFFGSPKTSIAVSSTSLIQPAEQKSTFIQEAAPAPDTPPLSSPKERPAAPLAPAATAQPTTVCAEIDVKFDFDKSAIKPAFTTELERFADFIKMHPSIHEVFINGHTDSTGPVEYNMGLSKRRAASVRDYLIQKSGLGAEKLSIQWFGPKDPVSPNTSKAGRAQNRRATAGVCVEE